MTTVAELRTNALRSLIPPPRLKLNKWIKANIYLTEAKRILSQFGQTPILARVDAALADLGQ